jgi:mono/diheme cytochrome c family protein
LTLGFPTSIRLTGQDYRAPTWHADRFATTVRLVGLLAVVGCAATPATTTDAERYLDDASFRRAALVAELVTPTNGYGQLRLDRYAVDGGWDELAEWNPAIARRGTTDTRAALELDAAAIVDDPDALAELGARAFTRYPVELWSRPPAGLWSDPSNGNGGLVDVAVEPPQLGATCATCHAAVRGGVLVPGLANDTLDLGWGPGRLDVTTLDGHEPVRIPDLRPVALSAYLHTDANVRQTDIIALAIRIETLLVTSHFEAVRPPRILALALATYLQTLAPADPQPPATELAIHGAEVFAATCAGCHAGTGFTGDPVALDVVGTDPTVGLSLERGTGMYRVPSLRGVADRTWLLHDGSVSSLDLLLDPARTSRGHHFGAELSADDRAALVAFLHTL